MALDGVRLRGVNIDGRMSNVIDHEGDMKAPRRLSASVESWDVGGASLYRQLDARGGTRSAKTR